jgi:hypothetical protein
MFFTIFFKERKYIILFYSIIFILYTILLFQYTVDDSFITYRYAKNLYLHHIWNWNPSNIVHEEAYTNFIYAAIAIIPEFLNIDTLIFFKILGASLIFYLFVRLNSFLNNNYIFFISLFFLLFNPYIYIHAYSGLETLLFIILLFELIIILNLEYIINERILYLILFLLPLTRPEGGLYSIIGFILFLVKNKCIKSYLFFIFYCFLGVAYIFFKYKYFGFIFPNAFYVKSANAVFNPKQVIGYLIENIKYWWLLILFFSSLNFNFKILLFVSFFINLFLYANSDLQMNYADRFPFQTFAPFFLVSFIIVKDKFNLFITFFVTIVFVGSIINEANVNKKVRDYPNLYNAHGELGRSLYKFKNENMTLMIGDAGLIPYFSEWYTYDFIGLANKHIAHYGLTDNYLKNIDPDLFVLYSNSNIGKRSGFDYVKNQLIIDNYIEKTGKYSFIGYVKLDNSFYLYVYLKNNVKKFNEIKSTIQFQQRRSSDFKFSWKKYLLQSYL